MICLSSNEGQKNRGRSPCGITGLRPGGDTKNSFACVQIVVDGVTCWAHNYYIDNAAQTRRRKMIKFNKFHVIDTDTKIKAKVFYSTSSRSRLASDASMPPNLDRHL